METKTVFTNKKGKTATIIHDVKMVDDVMCYFHLIETDGWFPHSRDAFSKAREYLREE
jgi:hypothetical protein